MEWTQEQCLKLINEYRNNELLWNPRNSFYYNKLKKEDAWREVSMKLEKDMEEVKKKMDSLKGSYRREKTRAKKSFGTGKDRASIYESKWFAYESLQFLDDKDEPRETINNLQLESNASTDIEMEPEGHSEDDEGDKEGNTLNCTEMFGKNVSKRKTFKSPPKRLLKHQKTDSRIEEAFGYIKEATARSNKPKDQCSIFGDFIAEKLRTFDSRLRAFAEHKIHNIIFELEMSNYDQSRNTETPSFQTFNSQNLPASSNYQDLLQRSSNKHNYHSQAFVSQPFRSSTPHYNQPSTLHTQATQVTVPTPSPPVSDSNSSTYYYQYSDSPTDSQH